jgi:threonine/homoserine/homoserine lactone efflux protein
MREVIAGLVVLVCLFLVPGPAFAYWVPDSYGQGIGSGLPGPQGS